MRVLNPQQVLNYMAKVRAAGRVRRAPFPQAGVAYGQDDPNSFPVDGLSYGEDLVFGARGSVPLSSLPNSSALTALNDVIGQVPAPQAGAGVSWNVVPFVGGTLSGQVLSANANRVVLLLQNQSATETIYFNLGQSAGINQGIQLAPGVGVLFDRQAPANYVTVIATNNNVSGIAAEGM